MKLFGKLVAVAALLFVLVILMWENPGPQVAHIQQLLWQCLELVGVLLLLWFLLTRGTMKASMVFPRGR